MKIGLTGGIASGKTTVSNYLNELGAEVINTDRLTHQLLQKGNSGWKKVLNKFGPYLLTETKEIDRGKLSKIVFKNPVKLKKLEKIVHPEIINIVKKQLNQSGKKHIIVEVPLLYETNMEDMFDQVWVVYVDEVTQIQRACNRSNLNQSDIQKRINSQISIEEKKDRADLVIENKGNISDLKEKVRNIWNNLSN